MPAASMHPNEHARLAQLRSLCVLDSPPEAAFDDIVRIASELTGCPIVLVTLVDECRQWFLAKLGVEVTETSRDVSFCSHALLQDTPLVVPDTTRDARFADNPVVVGPPGFRFYAGAPIVVQGLPMGTVCVLDTVPRDLPSSKLTALEALARQVAELFNARSAAARAARAERRFSAFMENAPAVAFLKDHEGRMQYLNRRFETLFNLAPGELLGRMDEDWLPAEVVAQNLRHDEQVRRTRKPLETIERVPTPDGVGREWATLKFPVEMERGIWVGGVAVDVTEMNAARRAARAAQAFSEAVVGTIGALVCVLDREGRFVRFNAECERLTGWSAEEVLGKPFWDVVLLAEERELVQRTFGRLAAGDFPLENENHWVTRDGERRLIEWKSTALLDDKGEVEFVIGTGVDITIRRAQEDLIQAQLLLIQETTVELEAQKGELEAANAKLEWLATTDGLTGLANRRTFEASLKALTARAEREGTPLALVIFDLDRFKELNDVYGHQAGDEALCVLAQVLAENTRDYDVIARYGGEEFVALMPGLDVESALEIADRLRAAIEAAEWPDRRVTASAGVANFRPCQSGEALLAEADRALYASKTAGRNCVTHAANMSLQPG